MFVQVRESLVEAHRALATALSFLKSVLPIYQENGTTRQQSTKNWLRSVPLQMSDAEQGKRPGTEVRASECDTPHYNFIVAGRNV